MSQSSLLNFNCYHFVDAVFQQCGLSQDQAALLRRADHPLTEYQAWPLLIRLNIDLQHREIRLPHNLIVAAIARSNTKKNGKLKFGLAMTRIFHDVTQRDVAQAHLRRILNCDSIYDICAMLRPVLILIQHQVRETLDYAALLQDLLSFNDMAQRIKIRWSQEFYSHAPLAKIEEE